MVRLRFEAMFVCGFKSEFKPVSDSPMEISERFKDCLLLYARIDRIVGWTFQLAFRLISSHDHSHVTVHWHSELEEPGHFGSLGVQGEEID